MNILYHHNSTLRVINMTTIKFIKVRKVNFLIYPEVKVSHGRDKFKTEYYILKLSGIHLTMKNQLKVKKNIESIS